MTIMSLAALLKAQEYGRVMLHVNVLPDLVAFTSKVSKNDRPEPASKVVALRLHAYTSVVGKLDVRVTVRLSTTLPVVGVAGASSSVGVIIGIGLKVPVRASRYPGIPGTLGRLAFWLQPISDRPNRHRLTRI